jgi:hypothetical protein
MHRAEILNEYGAFTAGRHGRSLCSQQSINTADSPKAAFVQALLTDPRYRGSRGTCVGCRHSRPDDTSTAKNRGKPERDGRFAFVPRVCDSLRVVGYSPCREEERAFIDSERVPVKSASGSSSRQIVAIFGKRAN